jgi:salicylate hydroxylase
VHVYEQAGAFREVGAGVQVSPNASRILHRLGLAPGLEAVGVKPLAWHQRRWDDGRTLLRSPLAGAVEPAFGAPHYQIHRADLLALLVAALPPERLHAGHRLKSFVDHGDRIEALFEDGARASADVLIGADGIHSQVRECLLGPERPRFTGCVAYRGLVPAERLAHLELDVTAQIWMGPGKHFVHYFVSSRRFVNFVAVVDRDAWTRESWTERGDIAEARAAFADWHPQLGAILAAVEETFIWGLFDRAPLPRWTGPRVALLGDACHPMLPFMAQGAAQAIEDGAALAACLSRYGAARIPEALAFYERVRLPRASRLQAMSAENKRRFHLPDGPEQEARDAAMAAGATDWSLSTIAWVYAHDAAELPAADA